MESWTHDALRFNIQRFLSPQDVLHLGEVCRLFSTLWDDIEAWRYRLKDTFIPAHHSAFGSYTKKECKSACLTTASCKTSVGFLSAVCASSEHHTHEELRNTTHPASHLYWSSNPGHKNEDQVLVYVTRQRNTVVKKISLLPYSHYYFWDETTRTFMWNRMTVTLYKNGKLPRYIRADDAKNVLRKTGAEEVFHQVVHGGVLHLPHWAFADWIVVTLHDRRCEEYTGQGYYFCVQRVEVEGAIIPWDWVDLDQLDDAKRSESTKFSAPVVAQQCERFLDSDDDDEEMALT